MTPHPMLLLLIVAFVLGRYSLRSADRAFDENGAMP